MLQIQSDEPPVPGEPLSVVEFDDEDRARPFVVYLDTDKYPDALDMPDIDKVEIMEICYIDSPETWSLEATKFIRSLLYNAKMKLVDKDRCLLELALIILSKD